MTTENQVTQHYQHGNLLSAIEAGLSELGKTPDQATIEDLGPVDEFHIGGRIASEHFLRQLEISPGMHVLDVGCGLGGSARFAAKTFKADVTGIDLTREYIETGQALCGWVGLSDRITLQNENATSMTFEDKTFDSAYMIHVGMNIEDKRNLFTELFRVLKPGSSFGVYDIMRTNKGELNYPVPWAASPKTSWLAVSERYKQAMKEAGFVILNENNRREFALDFFKTLKEKNVANGGPPPLGLHTLMQNTAAEKVQNMVGNIAGGLIAPVEIIARKP